MAGKAESLRSRLLGSDQPTSEQMVEALDSRLEPSEDVEYRLTSRGMLTHERGDETAERGGGDGGLLLAVTDRKLVFVLDTGSSVETADVLYTDLKEFSADSGLLSTSVSVTVWGRGAFSFDPDESDIAVEAAEFATDAGRAWQRVVAALQDVRQHVSRIPDAAEEADMTGASEARASARENLSTARQRIDETDERFQFALEERYERVASELERTWAEAHLTRGRQLLETLTVRTAARDHDAAATAVQQARDHLDRALTIAVDEGLALVDEVRSTLDKLDNRQTALESQPLELAEEARARAQASDSPALAIDAWERALGYYRDALMAGWATGVDFDGDQAGLKMQVEWVVGTLLDHRRSLAATLESDGDDHRADEPGQARDHYEEAIEHAREARRLAAQYWAGDADALADWLARLREKRDGLAAES